MVESQENTMKEGPTGEVKPGAGEGGVEMPKSLRNVLTALPTAFPLHLNHLNTRSGASAGVWLVVLVPLACSPGLYHAHSHCLPSPRLLALLAIQAGVSGVHLYQEVCVSGGPHRVAREETSRTPPLLLRLFTHPYTPALATALAISLLTDIHILIALPLTTLCAWLLFKTTHWLFRAFPGSFSLGEGAVAGQTVALAVTSSLYGLISSAVWPRRLSHSQQVTLFIQTAVVMLASLVGGINNIPVLRNPRLFLPYLCVCGAMGVGTASLLLGEWVPMWLWEVLSLSPARLFLLAWWLILTLFALCLTGWAKRRNSLPTTVLRKVYHVVITLVFIPGVLLEPVFLLLAATAATMMFLLLELVRVEEIQPVARIINQAFTPFLDEKDEGPLVLSHLYLLVGVASPLWLTPCPLGDPQVGETLPAATVLPLLAGVLAVGVGDTAASVGGTYLGRRRWSGTKKTVEGSVCGVLAQLLVVGALVGAGLVQMSPAGWGRLVVSTGFVAVVEALTDQVDNIVLPLLLYTPLMDL